MDSISIVILNYFNYTDTIECVDSILEQDSSGFQYEIIIVDNHSKNSSFKILSNHYKDTKHVHILKSPENEGFARGNNRGINYSLHTLKIDRILLLNNDTIMINKRYLSYLCNYNYLTGNIGAIGTRIIGKDQADQNPVYTSTKYKHIFFELILYSLMYINILPFLRSIYRMTIKCFRAQPARKIQGTMKNKSYILHGSSILLTPLYFKYFSGLYPKTFLYYEENILAIMLEKVKLKWIFSDKISVYHKEDSSSNIVFLNPKKVKSKYIIQSILQAIKIKLFGVKNINRLINQSLKKQNNSD